MSDPQVATLEELKTSWTLDDLAKANAVLDMKTEAEEAERKSKT